MNKEMPKIYDPKKVEDKIYKSWEDSGYFNPDKLNLPENAKPYTIILPPPNITDRLHMGHAVMLAIEDIVIRYRRMNGYKTLWVPGTDHAAIATQNVVEKKLYKEQGKTRHDLGKEKFLKLVWNYALQKQKEILKQTKKMGASLDWSRLAFTLDEKRKKAVAQMFVAMHKEGIIYRGERIVNWCPRCHSTLADDEVEYKKQKTKLYTFKYSKDFPFSISTTRPETKLGDTAVAVNPKDDRYKKFVNKTFKVNFVGVPLQLKIISDRSIDMDFGTGAVGVTPAHSMADWRIAENNKLPIIKVVNEDGKIRNGFGQYSGRIAEEARILIVKELKNQKLLAEEETENNLSVCYRCETPIEPLPSKQWFVSVDKKIKRLGNKSLKEKAIEVVKKEEIKFFPERFTKSYLDWMENLRDWCVSRQIWFGHEVPVWYKGEKIHIGITPPENNGWKQDEDSLDTWFSSGMWTFSTLGWPNTYKNSKKTGDLAKFHPTQLMETGYDILTLWVSRMIMMSFFALGEIPFEKVYLHGLVRDEKGQKMSKSLGNVIDPLTVAEKYGTDAVRLSLVIGNTSGNDLSLNEKKIGSFRNFTNKLWNISRYILMNVSEKNIKSAEEIDFKTLNREDMWILRRLNETIKEVNRNIQKLNFSIAGEVLKNFTWNDFADWYLEFSKVEKNEKILICVLKNILKLWHPFMPFVTESIWKNMSQPKLLMIEKWPEEFELPIDIENNFDNAESDVEIIREIINRIRNLKSGYNIPISKNIDVALISGLGWLKYFDRHIMRLAGTNMPQYLPENSPKPAGATTSIVQAIATVCVDLKGIIDFKKEGKRLGKKVDNLQKFITGLEKRLSDKQFTSKAPENIISQQKESLKKSKLKLQETKKHMKDLK